VESTHSPGPSLLKFPSPPHGPGLKFGRRRYFASLPQRVFCGRPKFPDWATSDKGVGEAFPTVYDLFSFYTGPHRNRFPRTDSAEAVSKCLFPQHPLFLPSSLLVFFSFSSSPALEFPSFTHYKRERPWSRTHFFSLRKTLFPHSQVCPFS